MLWALATHGPRLVEIFHGPLGQTLPEGMREFFEQHLERLQAVLNAARDALIASDRNLRDQKAVITGYRRIRDIAYKELNPHVAGIRDIFRGACGSEVIEDLGFALRMPVQAAELHEQAEHLMARLGAPDMELPKIRYQGVTLDPLAMAEGLRPLVEKLGTALENVSQSERETEAMKIAKDETISAYDRSFLWAARSAESLFKLAELPEIARRVRPSSRRSGVTDEVETQGPEAQPDDPEPATEEVTEIANLARPIEASAEMGDQLLESDDEVSAVSDRARPHIPPEE